MNFSVTFVLNMTCIIAIKKKGKVYMGCDSAASSNGEITIRANSKIFKSHNMIFGTCGSARQRQLLKYTLKLPPQSPKVDDMKYMCTTFISSVQKCFEKGGFEIVHNKKRIGSNFLVGYKGQIYHVQSDYHIGIPLKNYHAIGSGKEYALGCLFGLENIRMKAKEKIELALNASAEFSTTVNGPFHIKSI